MMATHDLTDLRKAMSYSADMSKDSALRCCVCCVTVGYYDGRGLGSRNATHDELERIWKAVYALGVISRNSFEEAMGLDWRGSCRSAEFVLTAVGRLLKEVDPAAEILNSAHR